MKTAIILQGWYQKPDANWYPWLKAELEKKDYGVHIPDLPTMHTDTPNLEKHQNYLFDNFEIDENTIIFGHSLEALLAMRVAEMKRYYKMFLVAGWDFNDLTYEHRLYWKIPIDHKKITSNLKEIYCISSDNDPYITAFHAEEMCKRLKGKFILIKGAGHLTKKEGVEEIKELLSFL